MSKLAIQIITYKSSAHLEPLLISLQSQTVQDYDLWVYDNSEDSEEAKRTRLLIEASGLPHHFLVGEKNIGFDGAHELMYHKHDSPFVMLLNDDVKLEPEYLEQSMKRIESDPQIGSMAGLIYRWTEERIIDTAGLEYRCLGSIVDRFAGQRAATLQAEIIQDSEIFGVSGAVGIYRRSAIEAAGGLFDPSWFMYKEDADLAIRLKKEGYVAWFEPRAVATHRRGLKEEGRGFLQRLSQERKRNPKLRAYSYANQWRIYARHFRFSLGARDIVMTIFRECLRSGMVFLASPSVFLRAWKMILTSKPYAS